MLCSMGGEDDSPSVAFTCGIDVILGWCSSDTLWKWILPFSRSWSERDHGEYILKYLIWNWTTLSILCRNGLCPGWPFLMAECPPRPEFLDLSRFLDIFRLTLKMSRKSPEILDTFGHSEFSLFLCKNWAFFAFFLHFLKNYSLKRQ